jgi:hypothetical protein
VGIQVQEGRIGQARSQTVPITWTKQVELTCEGFTAALLLGGTSKLGTGGRVPVTLVRDQVLLKVILHLEKGPASGGSPIWRGPSQGPSDGCSHQIQGQSLSL